MAIDDANTADLQARLHAYHKAIEEEFKTIERAVESGESEDIAKAARNFLIKETAKAAETVGWLAQNATSEATRLAAAKFVLEHTLGVKGIAAPVDPLTTLVDQLKGNTPEKAKARKAAALAASTSANKSTSSEGSLIPPDIQEERGGTT